MTQAPIANALSIAGSDPSGGAGIQADLKSFSANHVFGMAVITALTAQNTRGVTDIHFPPVDFIKAQINTIFEDIRVDAVKIGMVANAGIAKAVKDALVDQHGRHIVLDPVMVAKGGAPLLDPDAVEAVRCDLLPLASVVTPNLPEAGVLLGLPAAKTRAEMAAQGRELLSYGPDAVLMKGGHFEGEHSPDLLVTEADDVWFEANRIDSMNTHGTGCTLASSIAAKLAQDIPMKTAVKESIDFVLSLLSASPKVGRGNGPLVHGVKLN